MYRKTKLGVGSWTYPYHCNLGRQIHESLAVDCPLSPIELIDKGISCGCGYVQICENRPLDIYSEAELAEMKAYAQKHHIELEVGMRGAMPDNLKKMIGICASLGSKLLRCVVDTQGYEPTPEEIVENFREVYPMLVEHEIVLGIENHDRFQAHIFADMIAALNDRHYGIVLDTTNSLAQEETVEEVLDCLAKYTVSLHLKDYTIRRSAGTIGLEIVGTPVGQGRLKVADILARVQQEAQQDFSTIIEFWMPSATTLDETLEKELSWAEESVQYLQKALG